MSDPTLLQQLETLAHELRERQLRKEVEKLLKKS